MLEFRCKFYLVGIQRFILNTLKFFKRGVLGFTLIFYLVRVHGIIPNPLYFNLNNVRIQAIILFI
jgi:hypothetical protein